MRRIPLLLSLLLASSAAVAQNEGVMIFKSEQPYVSPFDKAPAGQPAPAATLFPSTEAPILPQGEIVDVEVRELDRRETEKRAQEFIAKPAQKPVVRKAEAERKKDDSRPVLRKETPKAVMAAKTEIKGPAVKAESKVEASVIPPKNAQNTKVELAPPPAALAVKEDGLTSFGKDTPAVSTLPEISPPVTPTVAASIVTTPSTQTAPLVNPEVAIASTSPVTESSNDTSNSGSFLPGWLLKAIMFFILGGLLMLGGWYWIKRQALYGDPAFHDPWFRPVKSR